MDDLREKCPWDKKQTLQSLRHLTIEETYELGDAILDNDLKKLEEMQDVYQSQLVVLDINSLNSYKNSYKTKIDIEIEKLEDIIYSDFDE